MSIVNKNCHSAAKIQAVTDSGYKVKDFFRFGLFSGDVTNTFFDILRDITIYSYICFCLASPAAGFQAQMAQYHSGNWLQGWVGRHTEDVTDVYLLYSNLAI